MSVLYLLCATIFTGRYEVVAKVMFLLEFVILFTGGVWQGEPPRDQTPPPPRDQTPAPPGMETTPTPGKQTPAYGLRAAGSHPTGMHCYLLFS